MSMPHQPDNEMDELIQYIRATRGFDFAAYKRTTLSRRVHKRMAEVHISSFADYRDLLEADADEFNALFNTILINVTSFFRDRPAWDYLVEQILPDLLARREPGQPLRIWSAGCAAGQEPYTLAMVLAEHVGSGDLRNLVKIYATDIDQAALAQARQGSYSDKEVSDVPPSLQERYFDMVDGRYLVRNGIRRAVIFGRHDLNTDAPIGRLNLLVCRNTLMYFNAEAQSHVLERLHFALEPDGYLFLGKAEMLLSHGELFAPVNMKNRVFCKLESRPDRKTAPDESAKNGAPAPPRRMSLRELAADAAPVAIVTVDIDGTLASANAEARGLFGIGSSDIGQAFRNLEISYRPVELRSRIEQAYGENRPVYLRAIERKFPDGEFQYFDVTIAPLAGGDGAPLGAAITFADVTSLKRSRDELQRSREDLETTYEELRSTNEELETTNEELQSSNEELETTNEELQSSNEELETTNEELQSSNEELETTNEELRSTNEELETTNEELRERAVEVESLNDRLSALLSSLSAAVVVLNRELLIELWSRSAEELWGVRTAEALGRSLATLDIGLPVGAIQPAIRCCLDGGSQREQVRVEGRTRTGRPVHLEVTCSPIAGPLPSSGVILLVEEIEA